MNPVDNCMAETNRKDLAAGVLKQAAQDLRRFNGATTSVERELYLDAYRWAISDDCEWPFSFLNVCQFLHLSPDIVRLELLADASAGFFSYWIQRCERAARSVQNLLSGAFTNRIGSAAIDPVPLTHVPIT